MKKNNIWMLILGLIILVIFIPGFFTTILKFAGSLVKIGAVILGILLILGYFFGRKRT